MIVIEIAAGEKVRAREMGLARIRSQANDSFQRSIRPCKTAWRVIKTKEIQIVMRYRQFAVGKIKVRVPCDGLVEQLNRFAQAVVDLRVESNGCDERLRPDV